MFGRPRPQVPIPIHIDLHIELVCPCHSTSPSTKNAVRLEIRKVPHMQVDIVATVGDPPITLGQFPLRNSPNDPDDIDTTVENPRWGYRTADSGGATAPDGSSSISAINESRVELSFLAPSEKDGHGNPIPSVLASDVDPAADGVPSPVISTSINVTVLAAAEADATRLEIRQV